jgi:hypothetical protein
VNAGLATLEKPDVPHRFVLGEQRIGRSLFESVGDLLQVVGLDVVAAHDSTSSRQKQVTRSGVRLKGRTVVLPWRVDFFFI